MTVGRLLVLLWFGFIAGEILRAILRAASKLLMRWMYGSAPAPGFDKMPPPEVEGFDGVILPAGASLAQCSRVVGWCVDDIVQLEQQPVNQLERGHLSMARHYLGRALQSMDSAREAVQLGPDATPATPDQKVH